MADTLLHVTLARRIAQATELALPVQHLIQQHSDTFLLGSVLFDLPYYDTLLLSGLRTLQGKPSTYHPFGQAIHGRHCRRLCVEFIHTAQTDTQLALGLGALTHFAVDIVFHAEIERRVRHTDISHDFIERQLGIWCHRQLLGHNGVGTDYTITATWLFPNPLWRPFASTVFSRIFPPTPNRTLQAPDDATLARWQRSFRAFGYLYSKSWFPWLTTRTSDDRQLEQTALELTARAIESAILYLNAAGRYRNRTISLEEFVRELPPRRMSDGMPE